MSLLDKAIHYAHQAGFNVEIVFREWTSDESPFTRTKGIYYKVIPPDGEVFGRGIAFKNADETVEYGVLLERILQSIIETVDYVKTKTHVPA